MYRFKVYGCVTATKYLGEFEAVTAQEAESLAMEKNGGVRLCHACTKEAEDATIETCIVEEQ
jgi:hypothetical protein